MDKKTSNEDISVAVLDGPTVGWVASAINSSAEILDLFDVAAIIEAVVLHDRVELLFPSDLNDLERQFLDAARDALGPLIKAGIVNIVNYDLPETKTTQSHSVDEELPSRVVLDADEDFTGWFILQTVRFNIAERASSGNAIVLPRQSAIYKMNRRVKAEHSICNLYLNYKSVRELAQLARYASKGKPSGIDGASAYWDLPLPPLCLDVLERCKTIDKIWTTAGDLWDEHLSIRRRHHEVIFNHGDKNSSPATREKQAKKLRQEWAKLAFKWRDRIDSFKMADTTSDLSQATGILGEMGGLELSIAGDIALDPTAPLQWAKLIHRLYERVSGYWRLRNIHDSLESYWKVNDFELYRHFERLFKRPVTKADHAELIKAEAQDRSYPEKVVIVDLFPD